MVVAVCLLTWARWATSPIRSTSCRSFAVPGGRGRVAQQQPLLPDGQAQEVRERRRRLRLARDRRAALLLLGEERAKCITFASAIAIPSACR
jgi:hypothetical protein